MKNVETVSKAKDVNAKKERGASMVEYALLVGLIAVVAITAITVLGQKASQKFSSASTQL